MNKELELEAKEYAIGKSSSEVFIETHIRDYIAGATSKYVEKQKIEFAIEQLNILDTRLQAKISLLLDIRDESDDFDNREYFTIKVAGIKLAKEEIRRDIKELEQKLSEL